MTEPDHGAGTDADESVTTTSTTEPEREDRPTIAEGFPAFTRFVTGLFRAVLGFYFLWAFIDKLIGFDYSTPRENSWIEGGSPTTGYLSNADGPLAEYFNDIAGQQWTDWLFMIGLLGIGLALFLGIGVRIAAFFGVILLTLMFLASLPPETNPIIDDHIIMALALVLLACVGAGSVWGFGKPWRRAAFVSKNRWLI
jgi:thiosulfate dehydrogenase (quinone) large subunit